MRTDYDLAQFRAMCERGEVTWNYSENGGFEAVVNEVVVWLYGSEISAIMLKIYKWPRFYTIQEPRLPFDEVPAGKFINWIRKGLGRPKLAKILSLDEQRDKTIWRDLNFIFKYASEQCSARVKACGGYEEYQENIKNKLFKELLGN